MASAQPTPQRRRRPRVILGLTGSVATVKWPALLLELKAFADVAIVATGRGLHFARLARDYDPAAWAALASSATASVTPFLTDEAEWSDYAVVGRDEVLHIELRKWADVMVIAPLSANSLATLAAGAAPSLLACIARAWPIGAAPLLLAPAMNSLMWDHPATAAALAQLEAWGGGHVRVVQPVSRRLACGDVGTGAMASAADVAAAVLAACSECALPPEPEQQQPQPPPAWAAGTAPLFAAMLPGGCLAPLATALPSAGAAASSARLGGPQQSDWGWGRVAATATVPVALLVLAAAAIRLYPLYRPRVS